MIIFARKERFRRRPASDEEVETGSWVIDGAVEARGVAATRGRRRDPVPRTLGGKTDGPSPRVAMPRTMRAAVV